MGRDIITRLGSVAACVAVLAVLAVLAVSLASAAAAETERLWAGRAGPAGLEFDDLVLVLALGVLAGATGWLAVAALLTAFTEGLRRTESIAGDIARRITPSLCRRLLTGACGAAVVTAPSVAPAAAGTTDAGGPGIHDGRTPQCATGPCTAGSAALPLPDRPVHTPAGARTVSVRVRTVSVRVRTGDTLWAIAARHLPGDASDADIARAWPAWFRGNRARIGPDPDLIHPGTRLRAPYLPDTEKDRQP